MLVGSTLTGLVLALGSGIARDFQSRRRWYFQDWKDVGQHKLRWVVASVVECHNLSLSKRSSETYGMQEMCGVDLFE